MAGKFRDAALGKEDKLASQKSDEIYRRIIDNTSDYVTLIDLSGRYVYASPSHKQMGYKAGELAGESAINMVHPEDRARLLRLLVKFAKKVIKANVHTLPKIKEEVAKLRLNFRFPAKSGEWHYLESAPSIVECAGRRFNVLLVSRDITERKNAEDLLKSSEEQYRTLAEAAQEMIFVLGHDGKLRYLNRFAANVLRKKPEGVIGKPLSMFFSAGTSRMQKASLDNVFRTGKPLYTERETEFRGRVMWLSTRLVPLKGNDGEVDAVLGVSRDITKQKEEELILKETNERLEEAQRIANFGNWEWDISTNTVVWSEPVYRLYGLDPRKDKPTYETVINTLAPECRNEFLKAINDALKRDKHFEGEYCILWPDGARRYTHTVGNLLRDKRGKPVKMFGVVQDVTESHKTETELMKFKFGLEHSPDAVFITDVEGAIIYVNPAFEKVYGYKKEEALGETPRIIKSGLIPAEQYKRFWGALLAKQTVAGEIINRRKNGSLVPIEGSNNPILDEKGNITGFLAIHHDITARKKAEEERHSASLYTRGLIEASLDPMVTISKEGKITDVNKATELVTGLSRKQLIGRDFCDYFTAPEKARAGYKQVLKEGLVRDYPLTIKHTSGKTVDVLYNATVYRNENGRIQGVFAAARDITERKIAEDALKKANRELHEKIEELERFSRLTVGRELKMIELKKRITELENKK